MKKIKTVRHDKIWGYELWLHSPLKGMNTVDENGDPTIEGPLVKIIKANRPLSVQVHPDDKLAKELENENNGKAESWLVLDAEKDSTLVLGIKNFDEKIIREKLEDGTFEELLTKVPVKKDEFYDIPAGLIHGIGKGVTVLEVQQPSDVTYRYFDYNRLGDDGKPRELHIDKAIRSQKKLDYNLKPTSTDPLTFNTLQAVQEFHKKPSTVKHRSIMVDLETYDTFLVESGEKINNNNYALIRY